VAAGLAASSPQAELTALLAADLAGLRAGTVRRLVGALADRSAPDCAVLADPGGRAQWLIAVWRTAALRGALDGLAEHGGTSLRSLYRRARLRDVPGADAECRDVDTPGDARALGVHGHM
jgi:molybdopterin-guanine dinucleotide biosynthesis protein A